MYSVRNPYVGPYVSIDAVAARENQRRNQSFCMMSMVCFAVSSTYRRLVRRRASKMEMGRFRIVAAWVVGYAEWEKRMKGRVP